MTFSDDSQSSNDEETVLGDPLLTAPVTAEVFQPPMVATEAGPAPVVPAVTDHVEDAPPAELSSPAQDDDEQGSGGGKVKVAAVLAGAAALANKVRQEAPKKVKEIRDKRAAGRQVIVTEIDGRPVAIGPFSDDADARVSISKVASEARIVELVSQASFFGDEQVEANS